MVQRNTAGDYPTPIVDRHAKPGAVVRLVILGVVLIASAAGIIVLQGRFESNIGLGLLFILSMLGVLYVLLHFIGFIQVLPRGGGDELSRYFIDSYPEGILVSDRRGRVVYANRAYAQLTAAETSGDVMSVEALLSNDSMAAEALYRLTNQIREGREAQEEFRLLGRLDKKDREASAPCWYRLTARLMKLDGVKDQLYVWQLSDITAEREEQERFFEQLQHAIDYLDHAPAGFLSITNEGDVVYINATLADWIGLDLTDFVPGSIALRNLIAGDGMALIESVRAAPGLNRTASLDLDMLTLDGKSLPVRLVHNVTATRDGAPGESRTIVLQRAGESGDSDGAAAAEMRFTRFFNSTPMAIASVNREGRILRTNAPFLKMFSGAISRDDLEKKARFENVIHERDRQAFAAAVADAVEGTWRHRTGGHQARGR